MFKYLFLMLLSFNCIADELFVDFNLHAHHWNRTDVAEQNLNEINPGIGLRFVDGNFHKLIGTYKNSDRKTSTYALLAWTPINLSIAHVGAISGIITGYNKPYIPAAGLYAVVDITEQVKLNITATPTIRSIKCYGFAGFQLSVSFN